MHKEKKMPISAALPIYSALSIALTVGIVVNAVKSQRTFFDVVIHLTAPKLNLVIFLNCLVVVLSNAANMMIYMFFGSVRTVESKFLVDKCQKKVFQFLLLSVVLRNSIDIYEVMSLTVILAIWMLHWLASKRTKGLVGEENRDKSVHARLLLLFTGLIALDALVSYIFAVQFYKHGAKMSDIYIMGGFEVSNRPFPKISFVVWKASVEGRGGQLQVPGVTVRAELPRAMAGEEVRLQLRLVGL